MWGPEHYNKFAVSFDIVSWNHRLGSHGLHSSVMAIVDGG